MHAQHQPEGAAKAFQVPSTLPGCHRAVTLLGLTSHAGGTEQSGLQVSDDVTISWMELLHRPVAAANALKRR